MKLKKDGVSEKGRGFEKTVVFEKDGVFEKDEVFENGQSVLISRLTECFSFMCVMVKKEGGLGV